MLALSKPCSVMGIVNVTPDSFNRIGRYPCPEQAIDHALSLADSGADIIDIGGESTYPGRPEIGIEEEMKRVMPVVEALCKHASVLISVDTRKPEVMAAAIEAGVHLINDVSGLNAPEALAVLAACSTPVCILFQRACAACDVVEAGKEFFQAKIEQCVHAGIAKERLILDPGFGFNKSVAQNLSLIHRLSEFKALGLPVLIGASRKGTIGKLGDCDKSDRLWGSLGLHCIAAYNGASVVRVHDVRQTVLALRLVNQLKQSE